MVSYFLTEMIFQSLYFLKAFTFFKAIARFRKSYFSWRCYFLEQRIFHR